MKKIISAILLIILMFDISGHILIFVKLQKDIKREIKTAIFEKIPLTELETFTMPKGKIASGFDFITPKEFRYQNKLYDIVKKVTSGSSEILYCVRDINEESLLQRYCSLVSSRIKDFKSKNSSIPIFIIKSYLTIKKITEKFYITIQLIPYSISTILDGIKSINDPPPKLI